MGLNKFKDWCKENVYSLLIIISAILGLIFGFILKSIWQISPIVLTYIGLPGKLIIRAFMMILVPLIVASLSTSITSTKRGENKRMIILTFSLFIAFSSFCTIFGTVLMFIIKPGVRQMTEEISNDYREDDSFSVKQMISSQDEAIYDVFMNLIPDNIIAASFMSHYTALIPINPNNSSLGFKKVSEKSFKPNMLGLCVFSLILGFAVLKLESKAEYVKKLLEELNSIIMEIMMALIKVMPIGMFCWMSVEAIKMKSPEKILAQLGWFFATAFLAFFIHLFLIHPGIYFLVLRKNPFKFYINIMPAIIVAFGSSSSALTLPMTMKCMEEKNNLPKPVSKFVLPLGMTIHMNGSAMYYPMVAIFVAQMHGVSVSLTLYITLCIFAIIMSMAFPGSPSGGSNVVSFIAMCAIIGIYNPLDIIAYTMTIDWFMERIRTATNIIGDCFVAAIISKFCGIDFKNTQDLQLNSL